MRDATLQPLSESLQLGARAYRALWNGIINGSIAFGAHLRPDVIAEQLEISTTPVRDALQRMEADGLVVKLPYRGWFVRDFSEQEVRDLYELRAALECFSVRLACARITPEEIDWLRKHQALGEQALQAEDMDDYRLYNRDLHGAILRAARNSYLTSQMAQLNLQGQVLIAKTIRLAGRPSRAIEEHHAIIDLIAARRSGEAEAMMERHILSALEDIIQFGIRRTGGTNVTADASP